MRIVHISTLHDPLDVRIFHKECRTLARAGYEVHLLINNPPEPQRDGVHFHALDPRPGAFRPVRIRRRLTDARERALALAGDVYHFHDAELITIARALKRGGARVIYDVHEDSPQEVLDMNRGRPIYAAAKYLAFKRLWSVARRVCDHFVCATPAITAMFPAERTTTIHNYPLSEEFLAAAPVAARASPAKIAYIGGISAIRGAGEMVRAMSLLPESLGARLVMIGRCHPPELSAELRSLPGAARVDFIDWQPRDALCRLLVECRCGLVPFQPGPNHLEALPNKIFEYMAAGLPVVASDFPLWRDLITSESCGLVADPRSPEAIAAAVRRILEQPGEAAEMGRRGSEAVRRRYNWEAEGRRLVDLYRRWQPA